MKFKTILCSAFACFILYKASAQISPRVKNLLPAGIITYANIAYANDTLQKHLLDIYLPPNHGKNTPLIVWIHGGAWMVNDTYADMSYMGNTIHSFIDSGYALASIDYRYQRL